MKRICILIFSLLITLISLGQVEINEIYLFPEGSSSSVERFIELKNTSSSAEVDISKYSICASTSDGKILHCNRPTSHNVKSTLVKPGEVVFMKINRTQLRDNFVYLDLEHDRKNVFTLYNDKGEKKDEINIIKNDRSHSISRKENSSATWSETRPTKGYRNKYDKFTTFQYEFKATPKRKVKSEKDEREVSWGDKGSRDTDDYSYYDEDIEEEDTIAKGKIVINEIFFIHEPDGFVNKDYWVELYNMGESYINLNSLSFTTDTVLERSTIKFKDDEYTDLQISPGEYVVVNISEEMISNKVLYHASIKDRSSTVYLMQGDSLVDMVTVEPLARHQTYSRLPDITGDFEVVELSTPEGTNKQLLPSYNTVSDLTIYHSLGLSLTDYNERNATNITTHRLGFELGFGWERPKKHVLNRYNFLYGRHGFGINIDSVNNTDFGTININTSGVTRADYLKFRYEIGVPIIPKINLFIGTGMSILTKQFTEVVQLTTSTLNTGETLEDPPLIVSDKNGFLVDNVEFDLSLGLEYQIKNNVYVNLSYTRDYFAFRFNGADPNLNNNQRSDLFLLKLIVPLYQSHLLKHKSYLVNKFASKSKY